MMIKPLDGDMSITRNLFEVVSKLFPASSLSKARTKELKAKLGI